MIRSALVRGAWVRTALLAALSGCVVAGCCVLAASLPAAADSAPAPMNLQQAVAFGLAHSPTVIKAQADAEAANATLAQARAATLPVVSGEMQSQLNKQTANNAGQFAQIGAAVSPTFSQNTAAVRGDFNGANLTNIYAARAAKQTYDQAAQRLRMTREQVTLDIETSFYTVVQDAELSQIAREDANYQHALQSVAEANFKAGKVAGIDQLRAQTAYTSALERLASVSADEQDARENLAQLIGAAMDQQFAMPPSMPEPPTPNLDLKTLNALALTNRPEVAIAQSQLEAAFIAAGQVDAPNRPNVSIGSAWGNLVSPTNNANFYNQCVREGFPPSQCGPGPSHFYEISVVSTWQLPFLDWGTLHAAHNNARQQIASQGVELARAKQQSLIDVDQAVRRLLVNRSNLTLASQNAVVARQAADIAAVQYRVGVASQTDVAAAQNAYLAAARDLLNAQVAYVLSIAKLKLATGTLSETV
jgi:outer membrane protein TolC